MAFGSWLADVPDLAVGTLGVLAEEVVARIAEIAAGAVDETAAGTTELAAGTAEVAM